MKQSYNIGLGFQAMAATQPDAPAIIAEDMSVSYSKLWDITAAFAERMRQNGIGQSSVVAVQTNDAIISLASILASSLLGAQYVAVSKELRQGGIVSPTHFMRSGDIEAPVATNEIIIDQSWAPAFVDVDHPAPYPGYIELESPWLILHSSGTTGAAKYMALSQRIVFDRSKAVQQEFCGQETRAAILFACQTRPFYARAIAALLFGSVIVDSLNTAFWQQEKVNTVFGSAFQVNKLLGGRNLTPKIDLVEVSGAKLTAEMATMLKASFTRAIDIYGAGETNKSYANEIIISSSGAISQKGFGQGGLLEIVDSHGERCPRGQIRVKNSYMVQGYLNAKAAQKKSFQDGWFYPGDFGYWGENNALMIEGREDELINISGIKFNPAKVDAVLLACEGIKFAACFISPRPGEDTKLMAFVELADFNSPDKCVNNAHKHCVEKFGAVVAPENIIVVPEIPRTDDGAPKRKACKDMAAEILKNALPDKE